MKKKSVSTYNKTYCTVKWQVPINEACVLTSLVNRRTSRFFSLLLLNFLFIKYIGLNSSKKNFFLSALLMVYSLVFRLNNSRLNLVIIWCVYNAMLRYVVL